MTDPWVETTVEVARVAGSGPAYADKIVCKVNGALAVNRWGKCWCITHLPTGCTLSQATGLFDTDALAMQAAEVLIRNFNSIAAWASCDQEELGELQERIQSVLEAADLMGSPGATGPEGMPFVGLNGFQGDGP